MTMQCQDALPLVPAYLDGELSEAQASLLRKHLLSCHPCRGSAQDGKSLQRWFVALSYGSVGLSPFGQRSDSVVPSGFAARVARRAFAGDTGAIPFGSSLPEHSGSDRGRLLDFVLKITAVAAAVMLVLAIALRNQELPAGSDLKADDRLPRPWEAVQQELDRLNAPATNVAPVANVERSAEAGGTSPEKPGRIRRP